MNAKEARELALKSGLDQEVQRIIKDIEERIRIASQNGRTSCCAFGNYSDSNKSSADLEAKKHFLELGYYFRKTGDSFGVPQDTEDICW